MERAIPRGIPYTLGDDVYVAMIYALLRRRLPSSEAKQLWVALIGHRSRLSQKLGRNVSLHTATADYFTDVVDGEPPLAIVREAAMYRAKARGRNCVAVNTVHS